MKLKYNQLKLRKKTDQYEIYDLPIEDFIFSITRLNPKKATSGHTQEGKEVYYFVNGHGKIQVGVDEMRVEPGDIVVIPEGVFHRVFSSMHHLVFACAFPNEELMKARRVYSEALNKVSYLGALLGKVENEYGEIFAKYRGSGGKGTYGTSDGICKNASKKREKAKKTWREAGQMVEEAWEAYTKLRREI